MVNYKLDIQNILAVLFLFIISGCQSIDLCGHFLSDSTIKQISMNKPNQTELINMIGTPNYISDSSTSAWYYIQRSLAHRAWFHPTVVQQKIVKITFSNNNTVDKVIVLENSHNDKIVVNNTLTNIYDNRQNFIQKFIQNLGRFNRKTS